jgi:bifunctional isochorismate lyase/aryl carrier protein
MAIPAIAPYPMPTGAQLPPRIPDWRPDPHRALLLVHDMQRYFLDMFPPDESPVVELLANVERIRRAATYLGVPVVYTAQPGRVSRERRGLLHDFWGPGMSTDPAVRAITTDVAPEPGDVVLDKYRYSAFHDSRLGEILRGSGRDQILVCGVFAHIGCLVTACDAYNRDVAPFFVADAVADFSARDHSMALEYAARTCAVVLTTDQLLAGLCARIGSVGSVGTVPPAADLFRDDAGQLHA